MRKSTVFKGAGKTDVQLRAWPENNAVEVIVRWPEGKGVVTRGASLDTATIRRLGQRCLELADLVDAAPVA